MKKSVCDEKKAYASWKEADAAARKVLEQGGPVLRPYKCKNCGKFHLKTRWKKERGI